MILIDDREDRRLLNELARFTDIPVNSIRLQCGDATWAGRGPGGKDIQIGFEHKRLTDLIACIKDRRLSGSQLSGGRKSQGKPGMYDVYGRVEIVIEGLWRPSPAGGLEHMNGDQTWRPVFHRGEGMTYRQVDGYLQTLSECADVRIWRTGTIAETAHLYVSRYLWWSKPYDRHRSHREIYSTDPSAQRQGKMILRGGEPGPVVQIAAQFPGIDSKAWSLGDQFSSIFELVAGRPMDDYDYRVLLARWQRAGWTDSSGKDKRFGKKSATEIVNWIKGKA